MRKRTSRSRGFTIIELMITVAIVAIFSTLAAPSFRSLIAQQRAKAAASAVTESLWLARSESVKRNNSVGFTLGKGQLTSGWQILAGATVLHTKDAFPAVSLTFTPDVTSQSFQFNAYGRMSSGGGTSIELGIEDANVYRCLSVSTTGRTSAKDGKCA